MKIWVEVKLQSSHIQISLEAKEQSQATYLKEDMKGKLEEKT